MNEQEFIKTIEKSYISKSGMIGVCGLSGSGKTTFCNKLHNTFKDRSLVISFDDFCIIPTEKRKSILSEAIEANDWEKLQYLAQPENHEENPYANPVTWYDWNAIAYTLGELKQNNDVIRENAWNQKTGNCDQTVTYRPPNHPYPLFFLDCIYMHQPEIVSFIDITVMLNISDEIAVERYSNRDKHRNHGIYLDYKKLITELYDIPYLKKYRKETDYIIEANH